MKWISNPLSRDHKPDIPEEKERINISGGRVSSYIDVDPVTGIKMQSGPARVYLRFDDYPGLAMSRSLGDMVAHSVGVSSEPGKHKNLIYVEIHRHKLSPDDKFMILASDGLWEFVSNEDAIQSVVTHWLDDNPTQACEELVKLAVERWSKYDSSIDDITVVVVFLQRA